MRMPREQEIGMGVLKNMTLCKLPGAFFVSFMCNSQRTTVRTFKICPSFFDKMFFWMIKNGREFISLRSNRKRFFCIFSKFGSNAARSGPKLTFPRNHYFLKDLK